MNCFLYKRIFSRLFFCVTSSVQSLRRMYREVINRFKLSKFAIPLTNLFVRTDNLIISNNNDLQIDSESSGDRSSQLISIGMCQESTFNR